MATKADTPISHVTDTAFWVACYREEETKRPDALFRDPQVSLLIDVSDAKKAAQMLGSQWVKWSVVMRTVIIDRLISEAISQGVDTILNLGAGLDTRPYRMDLPENLKWIEVDFEKTILFKETRLAQEKPKCSLKRVSLDLTNRSERQKLFSKIASESKNVLVLTEGVILYLTEEHMAELGKDLRTQENFNFWVVEYMAPTLYSHLKNKKRVRQMRNAPFLFMPKDWYGFFEETGWKASTTRYSAEESEKAGRAIPLPWWVSVLRFFTPRKNLVHSGKFSGFILLSRR